VIQCVNFAHVNSMLVAVRGGGHNVSGNAMCDGGLVIDLSRMKSVRADPADAEKSVRWGRDFWAAMQPYSTGGVYVNYLGREADEGCERIKAAYGPEKYARLVALKNKYDPGNLFRLNQNIEPSQAAVRSA
jgi:FAD/FMN-containing dehydrogenase